MDDFIRSKKDLIEVIRKLINVEFTEEEEAKVFSLLERSVPDFKELMRLIYWNDEELNPEQIVDKALSYQPIITPPPRNET